MASTRWRLRSLTNGITVATAAKRAIAPSATMAEASVMAVVWGLSHALVDEAVCPQSERQRVELELLSSVLPLR